MTTNTNTEASTIVGNEIKKLEGERATVTEKITYLRTLNNKLNNGTATKAPTITGSKTETTPVN